jgi:hypothetical protein
VTLLSSHRQHASGAGSKVAKVISEAGCSNGPACWTKR